MRALSLVLLLVTVLGCACASRYVAPAVKALFVETFQSETTHPSINWIPSKNEKYTGVWRVDEPGAAYYNHFPGDKLLIASESHRFYGLSRKLLDPIDVNAGKTFIIQYEFRPLASWDCSGGYLKFFSDPAFDPAKFSGADKYTVMFGPDRCGGVARVHFIINRLDAKTGAMVEHHLTSPPEPKLDTMTHLYQLVLDLEEQTFAIYVDRNNTRHGSLLTEFEPPLQPLKDMDDPTDRQPDSWVTQERIADPHAVKPADWDETLPEFIDDAAAQKPAEWDESAPEYVRDPNAVKPEDWNDEEDGPWMQPTIPNPVCATTGCGRWTRPQVRNPAYRGKWVAPIIANPAFIGQWKPRRIPNPDYFDNPRPSLDIKPFTAIGIDWWAVQADSSIDNIVLGRSKKALDAFADATATPKLEADLVQFQKLHSGRPDADERSRELQPWKFVAVGGFVVAVVVLIVVLKVLCAAPPPQAAAAQKPKKE